MTRRHNRVGLILTASGISVFLIAAVAFSPLALRALSSVPGIRWGQLSNIGQTYGAVSALLGALALGGVVISLLVQERESRHNRLDAGRTHQADLVRFVLEHPTYFQVFSSLRDRPDSAPLHVFINLYIQYLRILWEFKDLSEGELRNAVADIYGTEAGREYWQQNHDYRLKNVTSTRRERNFNRILDEVYNFTSSSRTRAANNEDGPRRRYPRGIRVGTSLLVAATVGAVANKVIREVRRTSQHGIRS
jgi:hypothetical protein